MRRGEGGRGGGGKEGKAKGGIATFCWFELMVNF